jgi:hypothetical protein
MQHVTGLRAGEAEAGDSAGGQARTEIREEAARVISCAGDAGVGVWLLGGLAVDFQLPADTPALFPREYKDIDFAVLSGSRKATTALFTDLGYTPAMQFNLVNGHRRLLFHDDALGRQIDVFVGEFTMCHEIPLSGRLLPGTPTLPLAELLMTKLQVVKLNDKDQRDILNLLYHRCLSPGNDAGIDADRIGALCAVDWGLWRTTTLNLERSATAVETADGLRAAQRSLLLERIEAVTQAVQDAPKSRRWRIRARVGDRVQWYEEPEEV